MSGNVENSEERRRLEDLAEAFVERIRRGEDPDIEEVVAAHPDLAGQISELFPTIREVERAAQLLAPARVGPYLIRREIGRGGMGVVYLAEDSRLGRLVALKVLSPEYASMETLRKRFEREAAVASRLDHPGICTVYEAGEVDDTAYIAMQYIEGESLDRWVASSRGADTQAPDLSDSVGDIHTRDGVMRIAEIIEKTARALHVAHEAGLIHRDIKPGNVIVGKDGEPVLLDFGLAREEESTGPDLTISGTILGTPLYMSPEQIAANQSRLDCRTDVYSLGATLYECLTLKPPFEAATRQQLLKRILETDAENPRRLNSALPNDLRVVLETALEKDRDRRYQTALDLAEDLRRVRQHEPIRAKPAGPVLRIRRWVQRRPALAASLTGIFLILVIALAMTSWFLREKSDLLRRTRVSGLLSAAKAEDGMLSLLLAREAGRLSLTPEVVRQLHSSVQGTREVAVLRGHEKEVTSGSFSPDGQRILTYGADRNIRIWTLDGEELAVIHPPKSVRPKAAFSPNGNRIVTWEDCRPAVLWESDGRRIAELRTADDPEGAQPVLFVPSSVCMIVFHRDRNSKTTVARLWNEDGENLGVVARVSGHVVWSGFLSDGRHFLTLSAEGAILHDLRGGARRRLGEDRWEFNCYARIIPEHELPPGRRGHGDEILIGHTNGPARLFRFRADGMALGVVRLADRARDVKLVTQENRAIAVGIRAVRIYDLNWTLLAIVTPPPRADPWFTVDNAADDTALSPAGGIFAAAYKSDDRAHLYDFDGREMAVITGHSGALTSVTFSPDGDLLLTTSHDGTARLWRTDVSEVATLRLSPDQDLLSVLEWSRAIVEPDKCSFTLSAATDRDIIFAATGDGRFQCSTFTGESVGSLGKEEVSLDFPAAFRLGPHQLLPRVSPSGSRILTGGRRARLLHIDGIPLFNLGGLSEEVVCGDFSPSEGLLVTSTEEGVVRMWTVTGEFLRFLQQGRASLHSPMFSPDGSKVVALGTPQTRRSAQMSWRKRPGSASVWSSTGELLHTTWEVGPMVWREWSPAGDLLLLSRPTADRCVALWRPGSDQVVWLDGHAAELIGACFSGAGDKVLTACTDGRVRIFDLVGNEFEIIHSGAVRPTSLAASPVDPICVIGLEDGSSRIYNFDGRILAELRGHWREVVAALFSASGRYIATLGGEGTIRTWAVRGEDLLAIANKRATRDFTDDERRRFADLLGE